MLLSNQGFVINKRSVITILRKGLLLFSLLNTSNKGESQPAHTNASNNYQSLIIDFIAAQVASIGTITEVPVNYRPRVGRQKLSIWQYGFKIITIYRFPECTIQNCFTPC
jgi:hypothetical protein